MSTVNDVFKPISRMRDRLALAAEDSDTALFYDLLYFGELLIKLVGAGLVAGVVETRENHRYRLEHDLVRANAIGEWASGIDDVLTGPASQHLHPALNEERRELTQRFPITEGRWNTEPVRALREVCFLIDPSYEPLPSRVALRTWISDFVWLRNKTRGHGAPASALCSTAVPLLEKSTTLFADNFSLFRRPWAYFQRNLSGKYRVVMLGGDTKAFTVYRTEGSHNVPDGIYVGLTAPSHTPLLATDVDHSDFWVPNGNYSQGSFDLLSYSSGDQRRADGQRWSNSPTPLPASETQGRPSLGLVHKCFSNLPPRVVDYVGRSALEVELFDVLTNDRHPVVTLLGRGGIGKTSLALEVLHQIAQSERFFSILWFSARDIDLLPRGPKLVSPHVLTETDIAEEAVALLEPPDRNEESFDCRRFFSTTLTEGHAGPAMFVFDNFETVRNPAELYRWIDGFVRPPNKVLITTRTREFKGDYPVEVGGMTMEQFEQLVSGTAARLGVQNLISSQYLQELYDESDGHPYVGKVLLGELAAEGKRRRVARIMAGRDDILEALFERTYAQLSPAAARIFLTFCAWRSVVPRVAVEAVLMRPANEWMDVEQGIEALQRSSLVESAFSEADDQEFMLVPLAASMFGQKKLMVSPMRSEVQSDSGVLMLFGAAQRSDIPRGIENQVRAFYRNAALKLEQGEMQLEEVRPILEYIARHYDSSWLLMTELYSELGLLPRAVDALRHYLERHSEDPEAWFQLSRLCFRQGDSNGTINALLRRASVANSHYEYAIDAARALNSSLATGRLALENMDRRSLVQEVLGLLESRGEPPDAFSCSQVAWLHLRLGQVKETREYVKRGLEMSPGHTHCARLQLRLVASGDW